MSQGLLLTQISAANKAAMVDKGYSNDNYAKTFVDQLVHYSPIIHRDTFIKSRCIETLVVDILINARKRDTPIKHIVSLGAGFSTLFMRLRDDSFIHEEDGVEKFVEVDTKDILIIKKHIMEKKKMVKKIDKPVYQMIAIDFKAMKNYLFKEIVLHADPTKPTLFIADCSLIFPPYNHSDKLLKQMAQLYHKCYLLMMEPFNMYDVFGQFTVKYYRDFHFGLQSPMKYSTLKDIRERLSSYFPESSTVELKHAARQCISSRLYFKMQKLDLFNEYEELCHLNSHMALSVAAKNMDLPPLFATIPRNVCQCCSEYGNFDLGEAIAKIPLTKEIDLGYEAFRHVSLLIDSTKLCFGCGFGREVTFDQPQNTIRSFECFELQDDMLQSFKLVRHDCFRRLNASIALCDKTIVIFGGKDGSLVLNDMIVIDINTLKMSSYSTRHWRRYPSARYRHASCVVSRISSTGDEIDNAVFIDGGRNFAHSFSDSYAYSVSHKKWVKVRMNGETLPNRHSHSICAFSHCVLYLTGGLINDSEFDINTSLYKLEFANSACCLVTVKNKSITPVFGHTSHVYKCDKTRTNWLILVGGIVPYCPFSLITMFDLDKNCMKRQLRVGTGCLLSNHTSHLLGKEMLIVGGGGFMSNFGTYFNSKVKVFSIQCMTNLAVAQIEKLPQLDHTAVDKAPVEKNDHNDQRASFHQSLFYEKQDDLRTRQHGHTSANSSQNQNNFDGKTIESRKTGVLISPGSGAEVKGSLGGPTQSATGSTCERTKQKRVTTNFVAPNEEESSKSEKDDKEHSQLVFKEEDKRKKAEEKVVAKGEVEVPAEISDSVIDINQVDMNSTADDNASKSTTVFFDNSSLFYASSKGEEETSVTSHRKKGKKAQPPSPRRKKSPGKKESQQNSPSAKRRFSPDEEDSKVVNEVEANDDMDLAAKKNRKRKRVRISKVQESDEKKFSC